VRYEAQDDQEVTDEPVSASAPVSHMLHGDVEVRGRELPVAVCVKLWNTKVSTTLLDPKLIALQAGPLSAGSARHNVLSTAAHDAYRTAWCRIQKPCINSGGGQQ
jgi:hypothetical protein